MATITEDYVSYEVAKLLKEKKFNTPLLTFYITDKEKKEDDFQTMYFTDDAIDNNHSELCFIAPTQAMVMKWLREKYNIYISIQPDFPSDKDYKICWCWSASILHENCISTKGSQCYIETYEEATEAAIKYCLENLI